MLVLEGCPRQQQSDHSCQIDMRETQCTQGLAATVWSAGSCQLCLSVLCLSVLCLSVLCLSVLYLSVLCLSGLAQLCPVALAEPGWRLFVRACVYMCVSGVQLNQHATLLCNAAF